jgi:hypothetical protein
MRKALPFLSALGFASLSLVACGGSSTPPATAATASTQTASASTPAPAGKPDSDKVTWKGDGSGKDCHAAAKAAVAGTDLTTAVTGMASHCVDTTKMHQVGQPTTGETVGTAASVKTIPLAAKANHCYRVLGLAAPTVTDFDIAVMDSNGKSCGEDGTDSNDALVLEDGLICFTQDDNASVNAAVASGTGKWSVEIWSD